jgi:hypothetical protein
VATHPRKPNLARASLGARRGIFNMGTVGTLRGVVRNLATLDPDDTIYVTKPWSANSTAVVALEPEDGSLPVGAQKQGAVYFLEVFIAKEVLDGFSAYLGRSPSEEEEMERVIEYAVYDT